MPKSREAKSKLSECQTAVLPVYSNVALPVSSTCRCSTEMQLNKDGLDWINMLEIILFFPFRNIHLLPLASVHINLFLILIALYIRSVLWLCLFLRVTYVKVCTHLCAFLYLLLPLLLSTLFLDRVSHWPEVCHVSHAGWPMSSWDWPFSIPRFWYYRQMWSYLVSQGLLANYSNLGPLVCTTGSLTYWMISPALQLVFWELFIYTV